VLAIARKRLPLPRAGVLFNCRFPFSTWRSIVEVPRSGSLYDPEVVSERVLFRDRHPYESMRRTSSSNEVTDWLDIATSSPRKSSKTGDGREGEPK
jgi:hypothetical protein